MAEASNSNDEMGVADIQSSEVTEAEMSDGHMVDVASPMPQESQISSTNGADQVCILQENPMSNTVSANKVCILQHIQTSGKYAANLVCVHTAEELCHAHIFQV